MLGIGWTEMLVIGVVALIVIGPKELPALMHRIGKFAGTVRRMGSDFQRELNKTTGLDEIKNLRQSVTAPLKTTADAIRREFNTTSASGTVQPSGALKPADPKSESVVAEIHEAAGMKPPQTAAEAMKDAVGKAVARKPEAATPPVPSPAPAGPGPVKATRKAAAQPVDAAVPPGAGKPVRARSPKAGASTRPAETPAAQATGQGTERKAPSRRTTAPKS